MRVFLIGVFVWALVWAGCAPPPAETPQQGAEAILELYRARDFDTLVRSRYAEIAKAENDLQVQALVDRFAGRFADDAELGRAVAAWESALGTEPELSEGGTVATFRLGEGFLKLSRMPDGRWGFHL